MRVEPDFPAGDGAQAFRPEGRVLMLDLEGHDLADERETARLVTRIYRYARAGRAIAVPQTAPSLAALCEKTGLSVISPAAGRVPADSAFDVAFGVDADALGDGEQAAHEDGSGRRLRASSTP